MLLHICTILGYIIAVLLAIVVLPIAIVGAITAYLLAPNVLTKSQYDWFLVTLKSKVSK